MREVTRLLRVTGKSKVGVTVEEVIRKGPERTTSETIEGFEKEV